MEALRSYVNWSEEVRRFLEQKVRELELLDSLQLLEELIEKLPSIPRGVAARYVREDRDSG